MPRATKSEKLHPVSPVQLSWNGVDLFLLPERAALLKKNRTLLVADLHLGKDEVFRASGVPVPQGLGECALERLSRVLEKTRTERLIILGDLFHAAEGNTERVYRALKSWRERHADLPVDLVVGNHDQCRTEWLRALTISRVGEKLNHAGVLLSHAPSGITTVREICGHVHPAVRLKMRNGPQTLLPCFYFQKTTCILPSFGNFTGHGVLALKDARRVFVIAGEQVLEVLPARRNTE